MLPLINFNTIRLFGQNSGRRSFIRSVFIFIFLAGVLLLSNPAAKAQSNVTGSFVGQVRDKITKKGLPGATVRFTLTRNGSTTTTTAVENGNFTKTTLSPGTYDIEVTYDGYNTAKITQALFATKPNGVVPPVEMEKEVIAFSPNPDITPVPTPTPTNTPSPTGNTEGDVNLNPRRDADFNANQVATLPLGGTTLTRTFDELALLVPGVAPPPQAIGNSVGPGVGGGVGTSGQFAVNGLRSRSNNFTVDGSDNNDEDIGVRRQGFFSLVPQPIESIQQFSIITLLAPAEFGRNLGAQVNALSKGGGNQFHGTLFSYFNSDKLNARNSFDNAGGNSSTILQANRFGNLVDVCFNPTNLTANVCPDANKLRLTNSAGEKDSLTLLQGGFAVGGRITRNKLFFFASGEGQLLNATNEKHFAVPTVEQRGLFNTGTGGLQQCLRPPNSPANSTVSEINGICTLVNGTMTTPIDFSPGFPTSAGGDAVFSLFPFPNDPNGIYGRNTYTQALSSDARGRIFSGKVDYNFHRFNNNSQTFVARYNYTDDRRDLTDVGGALFSAVRPLVRTDNFSSFLTGNLTNNTSNEVRFSWGRTRLRFDELRDTTGFLRPVNSSRISNAEDRRFLLNAPILFNATIPLNCNTTQCDAAPFAIYQTSNLTTAQDSGLGEIGQLIVAGFSPVGVDVFNFPQQRVNNTFQFTDTLRWQFNATGQHSLALGTDIRRTYLNSDLPRNSRPLVTFNGGFRENNSSGLAFPTDLVSGGAATGFFQSLVQPDKDARIKLSYNQLNFFAQDEWQVRPNINLNYGLRYEYNTTPKEADNKIEDTFRQQFPDFLSGLNQFIDGRSKIYESDKNNFAVRFGFAYSPASSVVVRGGFGMYFDQIIGAVVSQSRNVFPTFTTLNFGGGRLIDNEFGFSLFNPRNSFFQPLSQGGIVFNCSDFTNPQFNCANAPNNFPRLIQSGTLNTLNPALSQQQIQEALRSILINFPGRGGNPFGSTLPTRNLNTPLSYQYSIGYEQELFQNTFLSIAYVGTNGRNLLRFTTPNLGTNFIASITRFNLRDFTGNPRFMGVPNVIGTTSEPSTGSNSRRPNPNIGPITQFETTGRSRYDSLQIGFRGRLLNQIQYQMSYVYGSVKDDVSDVFDLAGAFALPQNSLTFVGEYAPANFDVRHRFTYNFIYDLPEFNNRGSAFKYLLGGWQIAGTGKFNTGQPFTVNSIFDVNRDGNLTDRLNSTQLITETGDRRQPLTLNASLTSNANANLRAMLANFGEDGSVPRNSFRAGSILDLDVSFIKRFIIREGQTLQFRTDIFNFINRPNFGIPVRFLEAPGFGQATDTVTPGRRIQFAVKYLF